MERVHRSSPTGDELKVYSCAGVSLRDDDEGERGHPRCDCGEKKCNHETVNMTQRQRTLCFGGLVLLAVVNVVLGVVAVSFWFITIDVSRNRSCIEPFPETDVCFAHEPVVSDDEKWMNIAKEEFVDRQHLIYALYEDPAKISTDQGSIDARYMNGCMRDKRALRRVGDKYCEFLMLRLQRVSVCQTANLLRLDDKRSNGNVFFQCDQELGLKSVVQLCPPGGDAVDACQQKLLAFVADRLMGIWRYPAAAARSFNFTFLYSLADKDNEAERFIANLNRFGDNATVTAVIQQLDERGNFAAHYDTVDFPSATTRVKASIVQRLQDIDDTSAVEDQVWAHEMLLAHMFQFIVGASNRTNKSLYRRKLDPELSPWLYDGNMEMGIWEHHFQSCTTKQTESCIFKAVCRFPRMAGERILSLSEEEEDKLAALISFSLQQFGEHQWRSIQQGMFNSIRLLGTIIQDCKGAHDNIWLESPFVSQFEFMEELDRSFRRS